MSCTKCRRSKIRIFENQHHVDHRPQRTISFRPLLASNEYVSHTNLLFPAYTRCPHASLDYIIEPWFLGGGADSPPGVEFAEFASDAEKKYGVKFAVSLDDLPPPEHPRLALISGRTADNPRLLSESIKKGAKCIYLEKPGAPTVAELEAMQAEAEAAGVEVLMGYNKNVCKYVRKTREFAETHPGSHVTFVSNNAYENTPEIAWESALSETPRAC